MRKWFQPAGRQLSPADLAALGRIREDGRSFLTREDDGPGQRVISLDSVHSPVAFGRLASVDVVLDADRTVSRLHAELLHIAGVWVLVDDGLSKNGSFVNGVRVHGRRRLADGDKVRLGSAEFVFHRGPRVTARRIDPIQARLLRELGRGSAGLPATDTEVAHALGMSIEAVQHEIALLCAQLKIDRSDATSARLQLIEAAQAPDSVGPTT